VRGGLARRAVFVQNQRLETPDSVLVVDSGDLFFEKKAILENAKQAMKKAWIISRAYRRMDAAAINVGHLDLQGLDFLLQEAREGLPLISANLLNPSTNTPIFSPYVIKEISGIHMAFFGLLSAELPPFVEQAMADKAIVKNPIETGRQVLEQLQGRADLIVLLSDLGLLKDRELVAAIPGIDFVLGGHDGRMLTWPHKEANTYIFQSHKKGMYVGKLLLAFTDPSEPFYDTTKADRIQHDIRNLDRRLTAVQAAQRRNPDMKEKFDEVMNKFIERRDSLQKQLKFLEESANEGNRFFWSVAPLDTHAPEDEAIKAWVKETGLTID
jgi:2',3'-cyclic-nucleotide 2'-phosphodiesterase (5'-nucleotidase family)